MSRIIYCSKLKRNLKGLDSPPYPGKLGKKIWNEISKDAWEEWKELQIRLVNENRLNLSDYRSRKYIQKNMEKFLFKNCKVEAKGYVPL